MSGIVFGQSKIGVFDNQSIIGEDKSVLFAEYNEAEQIYTVSPAQTNKEVTKYLWTSLQGDFILRAEVIFPEISNSGVLKLGWCIKNNLNKNTPEVRAVLSSKNTQVLELRNTNNDNATEIESIANVIQLERSGNKYIMSFAEYGNDFQSVEVETADMINEVFAGIIIESENINESVIIQNVRIVEPAPADFRPYQDYLGSSLEIMEVETGRRKIVYTSAHCIEAPNWTPDNKLIYNSKGYMYYYDIDQKTVQPINTGFAIHNNNDHVLNFAGNKLGISHHSVDDEGRSTIYILPVEGDSSPKMITAKGVGASYLHGWSPDEKNMIFTGDRDGAYNIFKIDIESGKETQLTFEKTLDDGSEYSADGKTIFFNSVRTGKMKIWKMDADGGNQTQLTFDEYNDWFPHISPDQKWIVFLTYPKDIDPGDHPYYKHCMIRIMPIEGGAPRVIGYVYGGQGTLNVPSWSPDGKYIAFVSNTK